MEIKEATVKSLYSIPNILYKLIAVLNNIFFLKVIFGEFTMCMILEIVIRVSRVNMTVIVHLPPHNDPQLRGTGSLPPHTFM